MSYNIMDIVSLGCNEIVEEFFESYQNPVYVNIIREPVELLISNYYYKRFGFESKIEDAADNPYMNANWRKTISENDR